MPEHRETGRHAAPALHPGCVVESACCIVSILAPHRPNPGSPSSHLPLPVRIRATRATPAPTNCMSLLGPLPLVNQGLVSRVSRSTTDLAGVILRRLPWGSRPHNQQHPGRAEGASVAAEEASSRFVCRRGANESHTQPSTHPTHHTPVSRAPSRHPPDHIVPFCVAPSKGVSSVGPLEQGQNVSGAMRMEFHGTASDWRCPPSSWMRTSHRNKSALHRRRPLASHDRTRRRKEEPIIPNNRGDGDGARGTEDSYTPNVCVPTMYVRISYLRALCSKPAPGIRCRSGQSLSCHRVISCPAAVE